MHRKRNVRLSNLAKWTVLLASCVTTASGSSAQTVEEFYRRNPLNLVVGAASGGSSDAFARGIAPYLTKYLPGHPAVVVRNKPGAGGLLVATELQHTAPRDGSYISTLQRNNYTDTLTGDAKVNFDPRTINNLGSMAKNIYTVFTYGKQPVTFADAQKREIILTAPSAGSGNAIFPVMLNKLAGAKFRMVYGYQGPQDEMIALERGEAEGRAAGYSTTKRGAAKQWFEQGLMHHLVLFGFTRNTEIPNVPTVLEVVKDPEASAIVRFMLAQLEFGRPFAAPPSIPEDRLAALREAFAAISRDPDYIADLARLGDDVEFLSGQEVTTLVNGLWSTPPDQLAKIKELLAAK